MGVKRYSEDVKKEIVEFVFKKISNSNLSLRKATGKAIEHFKVDGLSFTSVQRWIDELGLSEQYARAREIRAENIFEEILDIVDCEDHDVVLDEDSNPRTNHDVIQRDRLRVDARKWMLGKMQPKKYGEKLDVTTDGEKIEGGGDDIPIT